LLFREDFAKMRYGLDWFGDGKQDMENRKSVHGNRLRLKIDGLVKSPSAALRLNPALLDKSPPKAVCASWGKRLV
jgi:hypothetical protein